MRPCKTLRKAAQFLIETLASIFTKKVHSTPMYHTSNVY